MESDARGIFTGNDDFIFSTANLNAVSDVIDFRSLDMTDTLIGTSMPELDRSLGDPESDMYEAYHKGDESIADIELMPFDSKLTRDAGIQPYTEDIDTDGLDEETMELARLVGKKIEPKTSKTKKKQPEPKKEVSIYSMVSAAIIAGANAESSATMNDSRLKTFYGKMYNDDGSFNDTDDELEFTDEDFESDEEYIDLMYSLANDHLQDEGYEIVDDSIDYSAGIHLVK
jgi:hypothetical protein